MRLNVHLLSKGFPPETLQGSIALGGTVTHHSPDFEKRDDTLPHPFIYASDGYLVARSDVLLGKECRGGGSDVSWCWIDGDAHTCVSMHRHIPKFKGVLEIPFALVRGMVKGRLEGEILSHGGTFFLAISVYIHTCSRASMRLSSFSILPMRVFEIPQMTANQVLEDEIPNALHAGSNPAIYPVLYL